MQTANIADENYRKLAELFPNAVTEAIDENGEVVRAIDKDVLMQEINTKVVDGKEERYQFTWPDKKKSVLLANAPISKTLRPVRDDETKPTGADSEGKPYCSTGSVDFDTTENLYIEGDNLEVLKLLQETYLGKIKMIYIDPPYNTGEDFVYEDDFSQNTDEYLANSGQFDENGNRMVQNTESNGRFHTDWLNMIYPRLRLAKDMLTDDGVIFLSINDNEVENLKKLCDEVFGRQNFIGQWNWYKSATPPNLSNKIKKNIEYILCYEKNRTPFKYRGIQKASPSSNGLLNQTNRFAALKFPANVVETGLRDGIYKAGKYGTSSYEINLLNDVEVKNGLFVTEFVLEGKFKWGQANLLEEIKKGTKIAIRTETFSPSYEKAEYDPEVPPNFIDKSVNVDTTEQAGKLLDQLFGGVKVFEYPKPVDLIMYLTNFICGKEDIVMDFFSGSATTAHAVMQLNAEDGGHRKFIMVQLPEATDEKSEAYKVGYKNICEIGKERIRRAGQKIRNEQLGIRDKGNNSSLLTSNSSLDIGFRVLKCDTSNMKEVYYNPAEYEASLFSSLEDNIKEDRTPEDLLFQVMLDLGVLLSGKIEETTIAGKKVFNVEDNYLIACFDSDVTEETITAIAKQKPYYFVMRDSSMANDSVATNFDQIFATYSPDTVRKVL